MILGIMIVRVLVIVIRRMLSLMMVMVFGMIVLVFGVVIVSSFVLLRWRMLLRLRFNVVCI